MSNDDVRTEWGYEMKFLVPEMAVEGVLAWSRSNLAHEQGSAEMEPVRNGNAGSPVHISSLYFDTPDFDIYYRIGKIGRRKYRLRRYADERTVYLERKTKSKGQVRERCTAIDMDEMERLEDRHESFDWAGNWFHRDLHQWQLEPVCRIDYERLAYAGMVEGQSIRLAVDQNVYCTPASSVSLTNSHDLSNSVTGLNQSIIEMRFSDVLPSPLKVLVHDLNLTPRGVSKYRLGMEACGLVTTSSRAGGRASER
jgi:SPX domain protein involved in polyphosphate accumulation